MTRQWRAIVTREESIETKLFHTNRAAIRWAWDQVETVRPGDETVQVAVRPLRRIRIKLYGWGCEAA